jgi:hypothetical protein
MLTHISEISFPIQQRVEFRRLGELDLVDPAGALGVFIDKLGLAGQRLVYTKDFAAARAAAMSFSTAAPLCAGRLSMMTKSPRLRTGRRHWSR